MPIAASQTKPAFQTSHDAVSLALVGVFTLAGAWLSFHRIADKTFWFDEGVSVGIARLDWYNFVRILWRREANMSLYYLLLRFWMHAGNSEAFVRSLSTIFAIATVPAIFLLGRKLFDGRTGAVAALLLAVNAYEIRYAQEARSYSLLVLLFVLSSLFFITVLDAPTRTNRVAYIAISALAVYAHFFAGLYIAAQWLSLRFLDEALVPKKIKGDWRWIGVAIAPVLLFAATTGAGPIRWIKRPGIRELWEFLEQLCGNGGPVLVAGMLLAVMAAILPAWPERKIARVDWKSWRYRFLLLCLVFPPLLALILSLARPVFYPRYFICSLPALVLLTAAGVSRVRSSRLVAPATLLIAALSLRGVSSYYQRDFDATREDWRAGTAFIRANSRTGDAALFHIPMARLPYEYYRSLNPPRAAAPEVLYPHHGENISFLDFVQKPDYAAIASELPSHPRVWLVLSFAEQNSKPDLVSSSFLQMLASSYTEAEEHDFDGLDVRLYTRAPNMKAPPDGEAFGK